MSRNKFSYADRNAFLISSDKRGAPWGGRINEDWVKSFVCWALLWRRLFMHNPKLMRVPFFRALAKEWAPHNQIFAMGQ